MKDIAVYLRRSLSALAVGMILSAPLPVLSAVLDSETGEAFMGSEFGWLMSPQMVGQIGSTGDKAALNAIADLFRQKDARASFTLENYLERFPRDPAVYDLAGTVLLGQENHEAAILSFRRALNLRADDAIWTRAKLGAALLLAGKTRSGETELAAVLKAEPDNALALRYMSWLAIQRGDLAAAIGFGERSLNAFGLPEGRFNQVHLDLAELYARADRNWQVVTLLQPAVTAVSPSERMLEVYQRYLDAAMALGLPAEVADGMDRLRAAAPPENPLRRLMEARAALLMDRDAPRALALYDRLGTDVPDLAGQLRPDRARALAMTGDLDGSLRIFRELADERPAGQDMQVVTEMVAMLLARDRPDLAASEISTRLAADPARQDLQYLLAEVYVDAGDPARAAAVAGTLAADHPDSAEAQYLLGAILYQQGQADRAVEHLRRSVKLDPGRPNVWLTLVGAMHGHEGYAHDGGAGHAEVEETLEQAVAANPSDAMLRTELGLLRLTEGRVDQAIGDFDAALDAVPNHVPALNLGALARADAGTGLDRAADLNALALKIMPQGAVEQDVAGWIKVAQGDLPGGITLLRAALAADPDDATIRYHLGIALAEGGDKDAAADELVLALRGDLYRHNAERARAALDRMNPGPLVAAVHAVNAFGMGAQIGTVTLAETPAGLVFTPDLRGLPPGPNGAHVHEKPTCEPGMIDGAMTAGAAAGGHYGHDAAGHDGDHDHGPAAVAVQASALPAGHDGAHDHAGHDHAGHDQGQADTAPPALPRGDLAGFVADAEGISVDPVETDRLALSELRGRSLMIHQGPDAGGQSGPRIACAILR